MLHQIGAGVLGPVFLARDPERSRSVAVKVFRLDLTPEQAAELAAQLSALARANLGHPSIVAPFDAGLDSATAFLAEDYIAADSLDSAIRQYGPAPIAHSIRILAAVAGALDFAAAAGVFHGALHARDLLVTPDDTHVTGLGIGRALEAVGLRAPMRRPYVAPERVQREAWDSRADVYSLGVLARELLAGRPKADSSEPRLPEDQAERLQPVFARATAARPGDRFSTCLEFIGAVQDAIAGSAARAAAGPDAGQPGRAGKARAQAKREPLLPLEAAELAEPQATPPAPARLKLDEPEAVSEPQPAEAATVAAVPLADLDLQTPEEPAHDHLVDGFDLSEIDREMVPVPPPFDRMMAEMAPIFEPDAVTGPVAARHADEPVPEEMAGPVELSLSDREADREERFSDGPALSKDVAPETPPEPDALVPAATETLPEDVVPPPASARRWPSLGLPLVLVLLLVATGLGYLWGSWKNVTVTPTAGEPAAASAANQPATVNPEASRPTTAAPPAVSVAAPAPAASGKSAAPPAARNVRGVVYVRSTPTRASVLLNGRVRGVTPLRIRNVAAGRYTVRVTRQGYAAEEREIVVSADRPSPTIVVSLKSASAAQPASRTDFFGSLDVESLPSGARVFIDGKLVGTTPLSSARVAAGSHVLRVDRTGFLPWTKSIQIVTGQRLRETASLDRESQ